MMPPHRFSGLATVTDDACCEGGHLVAEPPIHDRYTKPQTTVIPAPALGTLLEAVTAVCPRADRELATTLPRSLVSACYVQTKTPYCKSLMCHVERLGRGRRPEGRPPGVMWKAVRPAG
jgi:hypothetical protein